MISFGEDEHVIKILRRHWFVMLPLIFATVVAAFAPFVLLRFFEFQNVLNESHASSFMDFISEWGVFAYSIWLLWLWIFFFIEWTDYYLDFWVITNKRIMDVEQKGFFHREVTSSNYRQIQDITVEIKGIIETIFKFGTLHVQTAGHERQIVIKDASCPEDARSLILKMVEQAKSI